MESTEIRSFPGLVFSNFVVFLLLYQNQRLSFSKIGPPAVVYIVTNLDCTALPVGGGCLLQRHLTLGRLASRTLPITPEPRSPVSLHSRWPKSCTSGAALLCPKASGKPACFPGRNAVCAFQCAGRRQRMRGST